MTNLAGPSRVVVIGGGAMGSGIAQSLLQAGYQVTVVEQNDHRARAAAASITTGIERWHARIAGQPDAPSSVTSVTTRLKTAVELLENETPDVVIESVPEVYSIKAEVLGRASALYPNALIGSNTSSLSVNRLAESVVGSRRFLGIHFFNPVPQSKLIELVIPDGTPAETVDRARALVTALGKDSIEVRDAPGFATSRLGIAIGLEAIRMVEEQVASPADIDRGMVLGYKFPVGPLELSDIVGLDVRLTIAKQLRDELGPRFEPPALLQEMVAKGDLGVKTGQGFYKWTGRHRIN